MECHIEATIGAILGDVMGTYPDIFIAVNGDFTHQTLGVGDIAAVS